MRLPRSPSYQVPFPRPFKFLRASPLSSKKRHLVQTITPVPGAIGHQQRVKAAAITNSDGLIPFTSTSRLSPSFSFDFYVPLRLAPWLSLSLALVVYVSLFRCPFSPLPDPLFLLSSISNVPQLGLSHRRHVLRRPLFPPVSPFPEDRPLSLFRRSGRSSPSVFLTPSPFTFGRHYRKSNFVTGTAQRPPGFPSSISAKLHVGWHRKLERFPLSSGTTRNLVSFSPCPSARSFTSSFARVPLLPVNPPSLPSTLPLP